MPMQIILLVDDTKLFLKLEQEMLRNSPVTVLTASNGKEAIDVAREVRPDLIFMDVNMPEMDGLTACSIIKKDPELSAIPVILVTTDSQCHEEGLRAGCDGFLSKPVNRRSFLQAGRAFIPDIDRRQTRVSCRLKVVYKKESGETCAGTCMDISNRGMFICSPETLGVDEKLEINLLLSGSSDSLFEAWCRVAWTNRGAKKSDLPPGFGVEFLSVPGESLHVLSAFLGSSRV